LGLAPSRSWVAVTMRDRRRPPTVDRSGRDRAATTEEGLHEGADYPSTPLRAAAGKVLPQPPAKPSPGDRLELTDVDYKGTHARHAKRWSVTDHTLCIFGADGGAPTCNGQAAMGGNQLLLFHTPGGGAGGDTVVSGGTGRFAGATGAVAMTEIAGTDDSDIALTVHLAR
jgi:hypothetical protein